jgi:hypothetical protein
MPAGVHRSAQGLSQEYRIGASGMLQCPALNWAQIVALLARYIARIREEVTYGK